jgi:hypothetical protein
MHCQAHPCTRQHRSPALHRWQQTGQHRCAPQPVCACKTQHPHVRHHSAKLAPARELSLNDISCQPLCMSHAEERAAACSVYRFWRLLRASSRITTNHLYAMRSSVSCGTTSALNCCGGLRMARSYEARRAGVMPARYHNNICRQMGQHSWLTRGTPAH